MTFTVILAESQVSSVKQNNMAQVCESLLLTGAQPVILYAEGTRDFA